MPDWDSLPKPLARLLTVGALLAAAWVWNNLVPRTAQGWLGPALVILFLGFVLLAILGGVLILLIEVKRRIRSLLAAHRGEEDPRVIAIRRRATERGRAAYDWMDPGLLWVFVLTASKRFLDDPTIDTERARLALVSHWDRDDEVAMKVREDSPFGPYMPHDIVRRSDFWSEDSFEAARTIARTAFIDGLIDRTLRDGSRYVTAVTTRRDAGVGPIA